MNYLLFLIISLVLSAFFSGIEIAFVSSNKIRIELDKKRSFITSTFLSVFTRHPARFIAAMLIGNTLSMVMYGIVMFQWLKPWFSQYVHTQFFQMFFILIIAFVVIVIFSEIIPRILFRLNPNKALRLFAIPVMLFYIVFFPVTRFFVFISSSFTRVLLGIKTHNDDKELVFDRFDLTNLIAENVDENEAAPEVPNDVKLFRNALEFSNIKLKECIVPRNELVAVEREANVSDVIDKFTRTGFSRLLVYSESIDNIIGYVHTIDMFKKPTSLKNIIHSLPIVPETMSASKLLAFFTSKGRSIALVVDEFGGTAGIVTLEDIIEEIFGEIQDEHDKVALKEKQVGPYEFILAGRHEIDYLNEKYNLQIPEDDNYETLAGFILQHNEDIPDINEIVNIGDFHFQILKASGSRIKEVKMWITIK